MMQAGLRVVAVAGPTASIPLAATADVERATGFVANPSAKPPAEVVSNTHTFDHVDLDQ